MPAGAVDVVVVFGKVDAVVGGATVDAVVVDARVVVVAREVVVLARVELVVVVGRGRCPLNQVDRLEPKACPTTAAGDRADAAFASFDLANITPASSRAASNATNFFTWAPGESTADGRSLERHRRSERTLVDILNNRTVSQAPAS